MASDMRFYRWATLVAWCALSVLLVAALFGLLGGNDAGSGGEGRGFYARNPQEGSGTIVFVHGVLGDSTSTWTNPSTGAYWPDLLANDLLFARYNIYVYEFPSPLLGRSYSIDELADNMRLVLGNAGVLGEGELIFLSHSMGGLVTRAFLLKYREQIPKIGFLYFYSSPTTGSELANIAHLVSSNPQFKNMFPMGDNTYLESLQSAWLAAKLTRLRSYCAYEILATHGLDVVTRQSGTNLCTEPLNPIRADHISIVKPPDRASLPYIAFKDAFLNTRDRVEGASR